MRPVLITGSSGLIGSALARALIENGQSVIGVDARPSPFTSFVRHLHPGDPFLAELAGQAGGIVHLAGVTRVMWGERDRAACWRDNVALTAAIVDAARRAPHLPWLIHASSREVYGEAAALPVPDDAPIAPINIYGASKAAAEALIAQAAAHGDLRTGIIRFSTVYGGSEDHPDRVLPAFVTGALQHQPLTVYGADVVLDPTWLDDVIEAVITLIARLAAGQVPVRPILLSSGTGISLLDLARRICVLVESRSAISLCTPRDYDAARFAGAPAYAAEFLGWRIVTTLDEGIRRYAQLLAGPMAPDGKAGLSRLR